MGKRGLAPFLLRRSGRLHYRRRVPDLYRSVDPRREVKIALRTYDEEVANAKAVEITAQLTAYWEALLSGDETEAARRALELERIARGAGFAYRSAAELAAGDVSEIMARVTYLHTKGLSGDAASVEALLAGDAAPTFPLSEALEFFFHHTQDRVRGKSPDQLRRWRNPRMLVVRLFIDCVGDVAVSEIDRPRLLEFRQFLMDRVLVDEINAETANKQLSYLAGVLRTVCEAKALPEPPLQRLTLKADGVSRRVPFPVEFIRSEILAPGRLDGLNAEARNVVRAMVNTGMRPSEIVNLSPDNIVIDDAVPHVRVRRTSQRDLKTAKSERDIPLVGVSLEAFTAQRAEGFPHYRDKESGLSATVNKFMRENGLRDVEGYSLYSLRHSFEDRLIEADADERMRAELMGHAYGRPKYGKGPSLEKKRDVLASIAL